VVEGVSFWSMIRLEVLVCGSLSARCFCFPNQIDRWFLCAQIVRLESPTNVFQRGAFNKKQGQAFGLTGRPSSSRPPTSSPSSSSHSSPPPSASVYSAKHDALSFPKVICSPLGHVGGARCRVPALTVDSRTRMRESGEEREYD
jgi:hypothetical protein